MKKLIAAIAVLSTVALFTACGRNTANEVTETTPTTTATESSTATENSSIVDDSHMSQTDTCDDMNNNKAENPLHGVIDKVIDEGKDFLPAMALSADPEFNKEFFLLDETNANYKNIAIYNCPMSAAMSEVIVVEAAEGKVEEVKADMLARQTKAQTQDAFYPNDVEMANASIVGTEGNYVYFILADKASDLETSLKNHLKSL